MFGYVIGQLHESVKDKVARLLRSAIEISRLLGAYVYAGRHGNLLALNRTRIRISEV